MGGIVLMRKDFVHINGFPNDFWGWGGEDDEFGDRVRDAGIPIERVEAGTIMTKRGWISTRKCHCCVTGDSSVLIRGNGASGIGSSRRGIYG